MDAKTPSKLKPPAEIELIYQKVGKESHVFTASGVPGFYYGSTSLHRTFSEVPKALSLHISRLYKTEAVYHIPITFKDFEKHLEGHFMDSEDSDVSDILLQNAVIAKRETQNIKGPVLWRKRHKPNGGWRPTSRPREGAVS